MSTDRQRTKNLRPPLGVHLPAVRRWRMLVDPSVEGERCDGSKEDMAVEFKPNDVSYRGMSQYQNGQRIPCVRFKTEVLPRGTPTDRFDPYLSSSDKCFLVDVAIEVQQNKVILYALSKGQVVRKD